MYTTLRHIIFGGISIMALAMLVALHRADPRASDGFGLCAILGMIMLYIVYKQR